MVVNTCQPIRGPGCASLLDGDIVAMKEMRDPGGVTLTLRDIALAQYTTPRRCVPRTERHTGYPIPPYTPITAVSRAGALDAEPDCLNKMTGAVLMQVRVQSATQS